MGSLAMHIFKSGSRNAMNEVRAEKSFSRNYRKMFKLRLPHMDTVNAVLKVLDESELEALKIKFIQAIIEKKVLHKFKLFGSHFTVAVDATGVHTYDDNTFNEAIKKEYKSFVLTKENYELLLVELGGSVQATHELIDKKFKKKKSLINRLQKILDNEFVKTHQERLLECFTQSTKCKYFHNVLEAKLVGNNGFCISLATQWIENPAHNYDKQDCEMKAFVRLAEKIKQAFKRLPICIVADGLYPNKTFFSVCEENGWKFICVLKQGSLKTVREKIADLLPLNKDKAKTREVFSDNESIVEDYRWVNDLNYNGKSLHWAQCIENKRDKYGELKSTTNFEYVCSQEIASDTIVDIVNAGRLRQRIEESFNIQKNLGYRLKHKYSRSSLRAVKNYYQCMQIAHLINQLFELSQHMRESLQHWECTLKHCWKLLMGFMIFGQINEQALAAVIQKSTQYRYTT